MFDSVLDRGVVPEQRYGAGVVFTGVVVALLVPALIWASTRPLKHDKKEAEVKFFAPQAAPPPPPPPPPPLGGPSTPTKVVEQKPQVIKKPDTIYDTKDEKPKEKPKDQPKEEKKEEKPAVEGGVAGGVEGGVKGGTVGGTVGGTIGGTIGGQLGGQLGGTLGGTGNSVIPFGPGMNRPSRVSGADPVPPREAQVAKVEGVALVKCTITVTGALVGCRIVKGLPFMDGPILSAVQGWHMTPVLFNGQPVSVSYTIPVRIKLQ